MEVTLETERAAPWQRSNRVILISVVEDDVRDGGDGSGEGWGESDTGIVDPWRCGGYIIHTRSDHFYESPTDSRL